MRKETTFLDSDFSRTKESLQKIAGGRLNASAQPSIRQSSRTAQHPANTEVTAHTLLTTMASTTIAAPKMSSTPTPAPLSKPVVFATSGLGGMLGWVLVHVSEI